MEKLWYISEVFAFGSVVKGKERKDSDINIGIKIGFDFKKLTPAKRRDMDTHIYNNLNEISKKYKKEQLIISKQRHKDEQPLSIFNIVIISDIQKNVLEFYNLSGAFDDRIIFLKKNICNYKLINGENIEIKYEDIEFVSDCGEDHYVITNYVSFDDHTEAIIYNLNEEAVVNKANMYMKKFVSSENYL